MTQLGRHVNFGRRREGDTGGCYLPAWVWGYRREFALLLANDGL